MGIAFFDLDNTLLATHSGRAWLRRELELGYLTRWQALRAASWLFRYSLGLATVNRALAKAIATLVGTQERDLRTRTAHFYEHYVRQQFRPGARAAIETHRQAGDQLVLLTASSLYLSELVANELQLDDVICTRLEVDAEGRYTGRTVGALCYGAGKLEHATLFAKKSGVPLSDCHFYTDSYSDLPVLLAVGNPRAVNPDYRLRREALRRRWPVMDWGVPNPV